MKSICILLVVSAACVAHGQVTNKQTIVKEDTAAQATIAERAKENPPVIKEKKPSEARGKKTTYSGIVVAAIQTDNLAQLINPLAPRRYGSAEDNLSVDLITRKSSGLKIFSIDF